VVSSSARWSTRHHEPTTRKALLIHESGGIWGDWQLNLPEPADVVAEVVRLQEHGCEVVRHECASGGDAA
jgi:hypothetical protein